MSLAVTAHRTQRGTASVPPGQETFLERFAKLTPIEVIALQSVALATLPADAWTGWSLIFLVAGSLLAPVILFWDAARAAAMVPPLQYVLRTLAFAAWALVLDPRLGPSVHVDRREGSVMALLVPLVGAWLARGPSTGDPP